MSLYNNSEGNIRKARKKQEKFPVAKNYRELAFAILYEIYAMNAYSDIAINRNLNNSNLEASEKSRAVAVVFATLSKTIALDELISELSKTPINKLDKTVLTILRFGLWQLYYSNTKEHAAVSETVKLCSRFGVSSARSLVNAILRNSLRNIPLENYEPKSVYANTNFNKELYDLFLAELGSAEEVEKLSEAFDANLGLNVRIRNSKTNETLPKNLLKNMLEGEGIGVNKSSFQEEAFNLEMKGMSLHDSDFWQQGYLLAQGESAMVPALAVSPEANEKIADLCAAPGGKSIHLYDLSNGEAEITANDIQEHRVELLAKEAERLNINNFNLLNLDASDLDLWNNYENYFDKVLIDVPCSGLGLINSKPEFRFTYSKNTTDELVEIQKNIFKVADKILKPGGKLVYSTCTLNRAENEDQVEAFLADNANYQLTDLNNSLSSIKTELVEHDSSLKSGINKGSITLWPHRIGAEGFYIAALNKNN